MAYICDICGDEIEEGPFKIEQKHSIFGLRERSIEHICVDCSEWFEGLLKYLEEEVKEIPKNLKEKYLEPTGGERRD